ncbi:hypothetical protein [Tropicimonas isoalkanivorans]|uniref:Astacin (Peptidase family M12A) n=1 Tax=Tropicimonas isoalkanivorans TaxID=441112 RepID=A0A1I1J7P5_9RHOB|nr:hypothetical protein [Tropicimonas isoalkanivorans]SFC44639.1 hypothetical protein SAMN04488094_10512 [Tropicimonas isoalkanivorans]
MRRLPAFILSAGLGLLAQEALACDFQTILSGLCPTEDVSGEIAFAFDADRGAIDPDHTWNKFEEFPKGTPIVLNVCFFQSPSETVFDKERALFKPADFSQAPKKFKATAEDVEKYAAVWETATYKRSDGGIIGNRLDLNFRNEAGAFHECQDGGQYHVLIAFNQAYANYTSIGWKDYADAYSTGRPRATMVLSVGGRSDKVDMAAVRHEFGHALGFYHEMVHEQWAHCPDLFLPELFIKESDYTFGSDLTPEEQVEVARRVISGLGKRSGRVKPTKNMDLSSIMTYPIKAEFFRPGPGVERCSVETRIKDLSRDDKRTFVSFYQ